MCVGCKTNPFGMEKHDIYLVFSSIRWRVGKALLQIDRDLYSTTSTLIFQLRPRIPFNANTQRLVLDDTAHKVTIAIRRPCIKTWKIQGGGGTWC